MAPSSTVSPTSMRMESQEFEIQVAPQKDSAFLYQCPLPGQTVVAAPVRPLVYA
ncbi:hypothetical protein GIB67_028247 [Kingdonia uniflora]|uniref:Uncharacterized protein n=1 Tax=Kingdonia uniflora TaxID=39325 RepID=A0A7J7KZ79_9MAGN|nr:hypothetical protein GIB67_028247 [Kingdonia uniflora]